MSKANIDPNIAQIGLDSGALTMLGAVVHRFEEPGEYRGTIRRGDTIEKVFYLSVDKESPVAAADIDLAKLAGSLRQSNNTDEGCCSDEPETRFSVNPRGYALFRVSGGKGGFSVNLRRTDPNERTPVFNSTALDNGAIFSARILRPGTYVVTNTCGKTRAHLTVSYPPNAFSGYRPPEPQRVEITAKGFLPSKIALKPAQGLIFECHTTSRIIVELERADDGPPNRGKVEK
ncbi:MAG: hypothetical protein P8173_12685 [Gammaproteobacteria bacterium]|jgi:hypothetical protein